MRAGGDVKTEPDFYFWHEHKDCRIEAIVTKLAINELIPARAGESFWTARRLCGVGRQVRIGASMTTRNRNCSAEVRARFIRCGAGAHKVVAKETLCVGDRVAVVADADGGADYSQTLGDAPE